jgi:cytochrome c peroxidase
LKEQGRLLFQEHCARCHDDHFKSDALLRRVTAVMTPLAEVATDPKMATNFAKRTALTGPLEGRRQLLLFGDKFGDRASAAEILRHVVIGVIRRDPLVSEDQNIGALVADQFNESCLALLFKVPEESPPLSYKARPLNGIWATAPYLHNGSVPNLEELLKPALDRAKTFYVGSREFDSTVVGFKSTENSPDAFEFRVEVPGNSNSGHEYGLPQPHGRGFGDDQRKQLIEYLKDL